MKIIRERFQKVGLPNGVTFDGHILQIGYEEEVLGAPKKGIVIPGVMAITNRTKESEEWGTSGDLVLLKQGSNYYKRNT